VDGAMNGEVRVVDDVASAFAEVVAAIAPGSIALSGGDTARACYERLTPATVDWSATTVLFGDERWVPVESPDSNEGMARRVLLDRVAPRAVCSLRDAGPTPSEAAAAYERLLGRMGGRVDVIHLGLGPDGHTASLFPGSSALGEDERWVVATGDDLHPYERLTFTFPAIARCRVAVFTVAGAAKRQALARVQAGDDVPAARVHAERVLWLADRDAA
jgi:6-phosphogluconolactonase